MALVFVLALPAAAQLAPTGTLRVTFIGNNPVQGRVDAKTVRPPVPCPDLVREFGRRHGVPVVVTPLPDATAVIESVTSGKADIGCLAIEAARATQVDFSDPYLVSGSAYAVRADSPIKTSADVDRAGVTVGAVSSQSQGVWVRENLKAARVHALPAVPPNAELAALLAATDASTRSRPTARAWRNWRAAFPGIRVLSDNFMVVGQAIAVPKGNRARLAEVNRLRCRGARLGCRQGLNRSSEYPGERTSPRRQPGNGGTHE